LCVCPFAGDLQITLFRLWHPRKPEYLLCADSEAEMEEWIGAILIEQYRHEAKRLTVVQGTLAAARAHIPYTVQKR
jgi:hypothetical protein